MDISSRHQRTPVSRRAALLGAGAAVTAAVAGCTSEAGAHPIRAPRGTLIMIIRHAEKPTGHDAPFGLLPTGEQDTESLTVRGWTRAGALVELFAPCGVSGPATVRAGLARPTRVVAANPAKGSKRPAQTLTPLAQRLGRDLITTWSKGHEKRLATALDGFAGPTLVAWEHEAIPAIVARLGPVSPAPPSAWPDDRFDLVWTFTRTGAGWHFAQVPQLLLAGDSGHPA